MKNLLNVVRCWCIKKLGGFVQQGAGRIVGQPDGTIKLSYMGEISNLEIETHATGVFTVRSKYQSGYPKVRAEYFDAEHFPNLKHLHVPNYTGTN